jgi:16S rRNA G966 N2-methylase RsmD
MTNALYFGDNLDVLRDHIKDESVDLIYLDPPFNSSENYNVLFRTQAGRSPKRKPKPSATLGSGTRVRAAHMTI